MSTRVPNGAVLIAALLAAAIVGDPSERGTLGLLALGIANVLLAFRGTKLVRMLTVGSVLVALLLPHVRPLVVVLAWLVWLPAFVVAWTLAIEKHAETDEKSGRRARATFAVIIGAVAIASLAYRVIFHYGLQQTAALFIGVPAILAVAVVVSVSPRSATGVVYKAVTVALLVSLIFLGEGMLCVVMAAPLVYLAAAICAALGRYRDGDRRTAYSLLAVLIFAPMSLEGVTGSTSLNRDEWITETRIVEAPASAVERALFEAPRFDRELPFYLRVGFPRPTATRIERNADGTRWVIRFRGGEMRLDGMEPRAGDLVLALDATGPGFVRWRAVSDDSHMTHFLSWREMVVQWEAIDARTTRVTWTVSYRRDLDPAWYFGPWERYAVGLAAGYLIESVATP